MEDVVASFLHSDDFRLADPLDNGGARRGRGGGRKRTATHQRGTTLGNATGADGHIHSFDQMQHVEGVRQGMEGSAPPHAASVKKD
jgi:hypothetical protein